MPENLTTTPAASGLEGYNFAYLDEGTKRMDRTRSMRLFIYRTSAEVCKTTIGGA